jgi:hypothetical protein
MHGGYPQGVPFHGEFSSADAHAPANEAAARMSLYGVIGPGGTYSALTLGASDQVIIDSIQIIVGATGQTVTVFDGTADSASGGNVIAKGTLVANGSLAYPLQTPHYCEPGTYPKVLTSVAGQIDVIIHGTIYGLSGT